MALGKVTVGRLLAPGDVLLHPDGEALEIVDIKKAPGRKPTKGSNLHVYLQDGHWVPVHSSQPIRILPRS